jgi:hypothetical protein
MAQKLAPIHASKNIARIYRVMETSEEELGNVTLSLRRYFEERYTQEIITNANFATIRLRWTAKSQTD